MELESSLALHEPHGSDVAWLDRDATVVDIHKPEPARMIRTHSIHPQLHHLVFDYIRVALLHSIRFSTDPPALRFLDSAFDVKPILYPSKPSALHRAHSIVPRYRNQASAYDTPRSSPRDPSHAPNRLARCISKDVWSLSAAEPLSQSTFFMSFECLPSLILSCGPSSGAQSPASARRYIIMCV